MGEIIARNVLSRLKFNNKIINFPSSLFLILLYQWCTVTQTWISHRRFCTTYRLHLQESSLASFPLKMGPIGCPETSVRNYHCTSCIIPKEHRAHLQCVGSLKSYIFVCFLWFPNHRIKKFTFFYLHCVDSVIKSTSSTVIQVEYFLQNSNLFHTCVCVCVCVCVYM